MVVDYRKLNEIAISDEFPLPKQEDILQALEGSQWLSTLDALAGFTQLEIEPKEQEKLAFRTHRGLWQFVRMPFGYKNGPSIFQRIMQNVLAHLIIILLLLSPTWGSGPLLRMACTSPKRFHWFLCKMAQRN